jgi:hypothetical protein
MQHITIEQRITFAEAVRQGTQRLHDEAYESLDDACASRQTYLSDSID